MAKQATSSQKVLGPKSFIIFLALLSAFVPLSTDLYLPALPTMGRFFAVNEFVMNLTLILFFIFYSGATLIWGPLSDRFGRRPILLIGLTIYMLASVLCGLAQNAPQIIVFRIIQAIGGGTATTIATAIIKDVYRGKQQEDTLAIVQSMVVISPALAPVIGALLLQFISWRGIFFTQAILGLTVVIGSVVYTETNHQRDNASGVIKAIGRLGVVLRNPGFSALLVTFSVMSIVSLAYISSSSYIFQNTFKLSSQMYSFFFSFNALGMLLAPLVYIKVSEKVDRIKVIYTCFGISILGGILLLACGALSPWTFALTQFPATVASSGVRPPATYLILKQQDQDNGSASSLYSAAGTIFGSVGMVIVSLGQQHPVLILAQIDIWIGIFSIVALFLSLRFLKTKIKL
ncbi:MAG: Bcr/CflA family efflux MFS transporter [Lactobacillus sp.]|nr:Bcr/CflA family efflux MFS transporter [Lactobacillus sp.]